MGGGVDAAREARDDGIARPTDIAGEHGRELGACNRTVAGADHADGRLAQRLGLRPLIAISGGAPSICLSAAGIVRLADADETSAEP